MFLLVGFGFISAEWINLNGTGEVSVNDANSLDGFSKATWNMWVNQNSYNNNAGIAGKYRAVTNGRSYLLRTSLTNSVSVIISPDGVNSGVYTSYGSKKCGVRANNEWTMITVVYDGSLVKYYRNGVLCDQDTTTIKSIHNSNSPLRLGGGNSLYFKGGIDEYAFYNEALPQEQIQRLYDESVYGKSLGESMPVLVYHQIKTPANDPIIVTPQNFQAQMDYLKQNGFETITMKDYYDWRNNDFEMPEKPVMLIFDDGFSTVYTNAKPIMDQKDYVGTVAIVTRYASFTGSNTGYMRWSEIQPLVNSGWDMQSHSITHSHMLTLNQSEFRYQLQNSKELIKNKTGLNPTSFVFPFHESNSTYTQICGEYYELCWTQGSLNPSYDFISTNGKTYLSLRRINIVNSTTISQFGDYLRKETNKAGEWNMEESSGTTTSDTSGNSNTGTLNAGAFWSAIPMKVYSAQSEAKSSSVTASSEPSVAIYDSGKLKGKIKSIDGIDNIVDHDIGKKAMKIAKEKKKYPDNMDIEGNYYNKRKNLTDVKFARKLGQ
jgi:peptidoglycan/xylan/chitin deacetylase (PgdA/CDA1 family)